ncbi:hypothetical protein BBF96_11965 [Anoxybacter fermentans]|uniref:Major facilitator superfamily (MFS) profile domain-containing protein n=1 Tax=Anoxybacter fermentans TaxID=1323375 RepID=A0A3S9T0K5_9FIRM|nr:MFS transporter [Anoxybacter fermentans]AZR74047.1 hypothetical protein BBF96_11965 [Anoxybacter fermentans]
MFNIIIYKRNSFLYFCSAFLRYMALGIFFVLFNLYIIRIGVSEKFLGLFLAVGNLTMALGSIPAGIIIDRFSKKSVLILANLLASVAFLLEVLVVNEILLLFIAVLYGFSFAALMCIAGPFLMQCGNSEEGPFLFSTSRAITLIGLTVGTISGGYLAKINLVEELYRTGLLFAAFIYIFATIPLIFIEKGGKSKVSEILESKKFQGLWLKELFNIKNIKTYALVSIIFFILGYTVILTPYINLYLNKRYALDPVYIGYFMSFIQIFSAFMAFIGSYVVKKFSPQKVIFTGIIFLSIIYSSMILLQHPTINIFLLILTSGIFNLISPLISNYVFENVDEKNHGTVSGFMNTSFNIGDSLSTYHGGLLIIMGCYNWIFFIASLAFILVLAFLKLGMKFEIVRNKLIVGEEV